jgi:demethylmenaquinone methyltransferase/2-methoxy-6-polyprenyl-1,4-benzoquinol methylase
VATAEKGGIEMPMSAPNEPETGGGRVAPHSPLDQYYERESNRHSYVVDLFNKSAPHYNTIEKLFFNVGLWYRRFSLRRAGLARGMRVLDVAMGTGAVARGAVRLVGPEGRVFGIDPSVGMIAEARKVFHGPVTRGIAGELPFADEQFDFVTMGIALRHVSDLAATFAEYFRVLRPGGTLWILEGHVPTSRLGHGFTKLMWAKVIPAMTLTFTRSRDAKLLMDYYWDTIEQSVPPETIAAAMREVGFAHVKSQVTMPGAVCEYTAAKPLREN